MISAALKTVFPESLHTSSFKFVSTLNIFMSGFKLIQLAKQLMLQKKTKERQNTKQKKNQNKGNIKEKGNSLIN